MDAIWVTGANGMLANEILSFLKMHAFNFLATGREVDICDETSIHQFVEKSQQSGKQISWIVNCAAYTAVDLAEDEEEKAFSVNVLGAENLARLAKKIKAKILHFSTDYVFSGKANSPILESEKTSPLGVYGRTKKLGEDAILKNCDEAFILRTSWLYGVSGKNFVKTILHLSNEKNEIRVVDDQKGTPTSVTTLAKITTHIIEKNPSKNFGIYNAGDLGEATWFEFACEILNLAKNWKIPCTQNFKILPCTTSEFPTKAKRPSYSVLSKQKILHNFDLKLLDWRESLAQFFENYHSQLSFK